MKRVKLKTKGQTFDETLRTITERPVRECEVAFAAMEEVWSPDVVIHLERLAEAGMGTVQIFESKPIGGWNTGVLEVTALAVEWVVRHAKQRRAA